MTKKFNLIWMIWNIVEVLIIATISSLCICYQYGTADWIAITISCLLGALIALSGALRLGIIIFGGRKTDAAAIFIRTSQIAAGIALITVDFQITVNLLFWFVAMFLLVFGAVFVCLGIQKMLESKKFNMLALAHFISAAVFLAAGTALTVLCMKIYVTKSWAAGIEALLFIVGVLVAIYGVLKAITTVFVMIKANKTGESVIDIISKPKKKDVPVENVDDDPAEPMQDDPVEPMQDDPEEVHVEVIDPKE